MLISDSDLNTVNVKTVDSFIFPPWDTPKFSFVNPFKGFDKSSTAPAVFQQLFFYHRHRYSSFNPIFTDGSKSDDHVGYGIVFPSDTVSHRVHNCCSVFTAELLAIFCALQKISSLPQRKFIIYTDSMSALETLSHYHNRMHPTAIRILSLLRLLQNEDFQIIFCWVPSHVGIHGNEMADSAAKSALSYLNQGLPYNDIRRSFNNHIYSTWQNKWDLQIHNKLHEVKNNIGPWPVLSIRRADVRLTRLRVGHTRFTHRYLIFGERAPNCPECHVDFSVKHILIECPTFNSHRLQYFHTSLVSLKDLSVLMGFTCTSKKALRVEVRFPGAGKTSDEDTTSPVTLSAFCRKTERSPQNGMENKFEGSIP
ncbi:uncharacterized protein LOC129974449 [Argiope bruennichi]|uniref:uncharacterized protein LOC129974449 n=1 Tax=Argiope bruennichi TaxID=94029 RepID=UPI002493D3A6|nr:uncharacterized protein LOC129974449 [Argiope bruennichi]